MKNLAFLITYRNFGMRKDKTAWPLNTVFTDDISSENLSHLSPSYGVFNYIDKNSQYLKLKKKKNKEAYSWWCNDKILDCI